MDGWMDGWKADSNGQELNVWWSGGLNKTILERCHEYHPSHMYAPANLPCFCGVRRRRTDQALNARGVLDKDSA